MFSCNLFFYTFTAYICYMPKSSHNTSNPSINYFFILIVLFGFNSCKKGSISSTGKQPVKTGTSVIITGNVLAGNQNPVAVYWKDGVIHRLVTDTTGTSTATGIAINDTDVYICGNVNGYATYWKNGIATIVANGASATAITVNGNDVYVAGNRFINGNQVAAYWKNNTLFSIGDTTEMSTPSSILVNGSDVYVAGHDFSLPKNFYSLALWKNGVKSVISSINVIGYATNDLAIDSNKIYITGDLGYATSLHTQAILWENANPLYLTYIPTTGTSGTNAIVVNNGNIYVAGYSNNMAAYWTVNGTSFTEHDLTSPSLLYFATAIAFNGADMYISGNQESLNLSTPYENAVYWKNGTIVNLAPNGSTTGIGVVKY